MPTSRTLFTTREIAIWTLCFLAAATLIVVTRFTSQDADSAIYADMARKVSEQPVARWVAPEWWGVWNIHALFREHPAGMLWLPALLGRLGVPAVQGAFVQGIATELGALLLIGVLVSRITNAAEGRAAMVLLQLMPVAFIFRIRSNHEYPMLFCLVLMLVGLDSVRRSWMWVLVVAAALSAAMLVKGVFVILLLIAAGLWALLNPTRGPGTMARPVVAIAIGIGAMVLVALAYDAWYLKVTGETFWGPYWRRQLGPVTVANPLTGAATALHHLGFYILRILWHPAPWSFAAVALAWRYRRGLVAQARKLLPANEQRAIVFAGLFVLAVIGLLFPLSRWAERYAFSATYTAAALGAVIACRTWTPIRALDRFWTTSSVPAAVLWLSLIVLRLVLGPWLPRLQ